jgi:bifunctional non-homologous end joining protein LigD
MEERKVEAGPAALRGRIAALGAPRGGVSARGQPFMLATLAARPFSKPGWLFEIKYDGVRTLAVRHEEEVALYGRSGQAIAGRYPELAAALRALPIRRFLIDGEIVALDAAGRPSFQRLQSRMGLTSARDVERAAARAPVVGVFFDCLALDGHDLRGLPLRARKECLRLLLPAVGPVRFGDHVEDAGEAFFEAVSAAGLEGIVAKRADSRYVGGRSRDWIKIKCHRRQEFVIGGYTDPQGARPYLGAVHVGLYEDGRLVYVSKVGAGFDVATLTALHAALARLRRPTSPFEIGTPVGRGHHWVEPRLVCEVRFTEWTDDGGLRHPIFLGLRADKRPEECRREEAAPLPGRPEPPRAAQRDVVPVSIAAPAARTPAVKLTNFGKVFWPGEGFTKGDLLAYYETVSPLLLPYLRDRPLVLTRYPDGISGKSFFQKDAPDFVPAWVRTERIYSHDARREIDYFIVDDAPTLAYVINLGTIPLHLWSSRLSSLDRPDWLILDLDPKSAPFSDVIEVARALHRILDDLDLPSYAKTSGATGLHILVPLGARYSHEEARNFARLLAILATRARPAIATIARPIHARGGKVYVDFGQNGHGRTVVGPYSVRPLPGAPVSCPLRWSEVAPGLDPARFTITTLPARFAKTSDPLAAVLTGGIDMAAAIARIERHVRAR